MPMKLQLQLTPPFNERRIQPQIYQKHNQTLYLNKLKVWHQLDNLTVRLLLPYHMIRVTQAVEEAKAEGVSTVEDSPMDLGNTRSAVETNQQISKSRSRCPKTG